jgi:hypothetical protein
MLTFVAKPVAAGCRSNPKNLMPLPTCCRTLWRKGASSGFFAVISANLAWNFPGAISICR